MPIKRPTIVLLLTLCFTFSPGFFSVSYALWGFGEKDPVLVSVNEDQLTAADFRHWWTEWQEEGMPLPERPDVFIDWTVELDPHDRLLRMWFTIFSLERQTILQIP